MLRLEVPYADKDEAKQLGARWNVAGKFWYVPDGKRYEPFVKWVPGDLILCNAWLALFIRQCHKCHKSTPVIGLVTTRSGGIYYDENKIAKINWMNDFKTMPISKPPVKLAKFFEQEFNFKRNYSKSIHESYFANNCTTCDVLQGNYHLFGEIGAETFNPTSIEEAKRISLIRINLPYYVGIKTDMEVYEIMDSDIESGYKFYDKYKGKDLIWE